MIINNIIFYGPLAKKIIKLRKEFNDFLPKPLKKNEPIVGILKKKHNELLEDQTILNRLSDLKNQKETLLFIKKESSPSSNLNSLKTSLKDVFNRKIENDQNSSFTFNQEGSLKQVKNNENQFLVNKDTFLDNLSEWNVSLKDNLQSFYNYLDSVYSEEGLHLVNNTLFFDSQEERDNLKEILNLFFLKTDLLISSNVDFLIKIKEKIDLNLGLLNSNSLNFENDLKILLEGNNNIQTLNRIKDFFETIAFDLESLSNFENYTFEKFPYLKEKVKLSLEIVEFVIHFFEEDFLIKINSFLDTYKKKETQPSDPLNDSFLKIKTAVSQNKEDFSFRYQYILLSKILEILSLKNGTAFYFLENRNFSTTSFNPVLYYSYLDSGSLIDDYLTLDLERNFQDNSFFIFHDANHLPPLMEVTSDKPFNLSYYFKSVNDKTISETEEPLIDFFNKSQFLNLDSITQTAYIFYKMEILSYIFSSFKNFNYFYSSRGEVFEFDRIFILDFKKLILKSTSENSFKLNNKLINLDSTLCYRINNLKNADNWFFSLSNKFNKDFTKELLINEMSVNLNDIILFQKSFLKFGLSFLFESRKPISNFIIEYDQVNKMFILPFVSLNEATIFNSQETNSILIDFLKRLINLEIQFSKPLEFFTLDDHKKLSEWILQDKNTCAALISYEDLPEFYQIYLSDDIELIKGSTKEYLLKYWFSSEDKYSFINLFKSFSSDSKINKIYSQVFEKYYIDKKQNQILINPKPEKILGGYISFSEILNPDFNSQGFLYYKNIIEPNNDSFKVSIYKKTENSDLVVEVISGNFLISQTMNEIYWKDSIYRQFENKIELYPDTENDEKILNKFVKKMFFVDFFKVKEKVRQATFYFHEFEIIEGKRMWKAQSNNPFSLKCSLVVDTNGDFVILKEEIIKSTEDILIEEYLNLLKQIKLSVSKFEYSNALLDKINLIKQDKFKELIEKEKIDNKDFLSFCFDLPITFFQNN